MSLDTYAKIWGRVLLRCPSASSFLARDWVTNAFRRVAERRDWSWLVKPGQFTFNTLYNTGTVTVANLSATVTGSGTTWTSAMVGRQIRIGLANPIYTITAVTAPTSLTIDSPWGPATISTGSPYEIYNAFVSPPTDFHHFLTIWDPAYNWQLHRNVTQIELNLWDAQRSNRGQAYLVASRDWYNTLPRFEAWPHVTSQYVIPFLYVARATDLEDSGAVLPRYIRGDLLMEMALAEAAKWPGPSADAPNPYFNLNLAKLHEGKVEYMINEVERQDEEIMVMNVQYQTVSQLPWAPLPLDAAYWQKHAM
jgi:hypothetical protein